MVILDFKAFDTVPHQRLLCKLSNVGLKTVSWLGSRSFLPTDTSESSWRESHHLNLQSPPEFPKASCWAPCCFYYTLMIFLTLYHRIYTRLFADDCIMYREIKSPQDSALLQKDIDSLCQWENTWQMSFNSAKCYMSCMSLTKPNLSTRSTTRMAGPWRVLVIIHTLGGDQ